MDSLLRAELYNLDRLRRDGSLSALACHGLHLYVRLLFFRRLLLVRIQQHAQG